MIADKDCTNITFIISDLLSVCLRGVVCGGSVGGAVPERNPPDISKQIDGEAFSMHMSACLPVLRSLQTILIFLAL